MKHIYHRPQVKSQFNECYAALQIIRSLGYTDESKAKLDKAFDKVEHLSNTKEYQDLQLAATNVLLKY